MAIPTKPEKTEDTLIETKFYRVYSTLDSGAREEYPSGAKRDTQAGKTRWDLIPLGPLQRLAELYSRGAEKYGEHNYQKGISYSRVWASFLRHAFSWAMGVKNGEDHLAAATWNLFALMYYEDEIAAGRLPESLNDMPKFDISKKE